MKLKRIFLNLFFCFILVYYLIQQQWLISQFKSLPSPIYGGDYYFQLGSIIHIMQGGSPLEAPNIPGSEPGYFILYSLLVALFGLCFNLTAMQAMFIFSQVLLAISLVVFYFLAFRFFKNKLFALLAVLLYLPLTRFPVLKYTDFTYVLVMPLFFFSLYYFLKKRNLRSSLTLGVVAGLANISHGSAFFVTNATFILLFLYYSFFRYISFNIEKLQLIIRIQHPWKDFIYGLKLIFPVFLISFLISLLWWYKPIFVYHGKTLNDMQNWGFPDFSRIDYQLKYLFSTLQRYFLNFSSIRTILTSLLSLLGLYFIFKNNNTLENNYIKFLVLLSIIVSFHYFVTEPLLSTHFSPPRTQEFTFPFTVALLSCFGLQRVIDFKNRKHVFGIFLFILLILTSNTLDFMDKIENDKWIAVGKQPLSQELLAMQKWVLDNTDVNDVFLSTNELSFVLNALTGRKVVITRRSQNSPFIDIEQREIDAAVMLYGNDTEKTRELLRKYNVKYLYWSYYWIQSEYTIENNKIMNYFDPILVKESHEFRDYFDKYGVRYIKMNTWIDPAMRGDEYRKYNLLFVLPKYRNYTRPWSESLDRYLNLVWEYKIENQTLVKIYKVVV